MKLFLISHIARITGTTRITGITRIFLATTGLCCAVNAHTVTAVPTVSAPAPLSLVLTSSAESASQAPDLICPAKPAKNTKPKSKPKTGSQSAGQPATTQSATEMQEVILTPPSVEELRELDITVGAAGGISAGGVAAGSTTLLSSDFSFASRAKTKATSNANAPYKIAVWGDSHMAAGFFTNELLAQLALPSERISQPWIPASIGRAGVRLPLKKSCASQGWRYESPSINATTGPGLINMSATQAGAWLSMDLRPSAKNNAPTGAAKLSVFFKSTSTQQSPTVLRITVNGNETHTIATSASAAGQQVTGQLDLLSPNTAIATVRIELVSGAFTLHGVKIVRTEQAQQQPLLQFDLFGIPGATVSGWQQMNAAYFSQWFANDAYDLVMLAYGTNEGNVSPFDISVYQNNLRQSLRAMRQQFPLAACVLIAPGDRGILLKRSVSKKGIKNKKGTGTGAGTKASTTTKPAYSKGDLLRYSSIHAAIGQAQSSIGAEFACQTWSALDAMGGAGSAYAWQRQQPALMAGDLIHFSVNGYKTLAQRFAEATRWQQLFQP